MIPADVALLCAGFAAGVGVGTGTFPLAASGLGAVLLYAGLRVGGIL